MLRKDFDNNSYLVNNNALYRKHTEHISTTEPLYLDGMPGSDNIVHEDREKLRRAFEWIDTLLGILNENLADQYGLAKLGTVKLNSMYGQCLIIFQGSDVNRWMPIQLNSYIILDSNGDGCLEVIDADSLPEEYDDIAQQAMQEDSLYVDGEIVDMPTLDLSLIQSAMQILWNEESLAELGINSEEDLQKLPILNIPVSELSRHPEFILAERVPHGDTPFSPQHYKYQTSVEGTFFIFDRNTESNANVIISDKTNMRIVVDESGKIIELSGGSADEGYLEWMKRMLERNGISLETTGTESTDLGLNDTIPNWKEYILLETA